MAREPNRLLRVLVPLLLLVVGGGIIFYSVMRNTTGAVSPAPGSSAAAGAAATQTSPATTIANSGTTGSTSAQTPSAPATNPAATTLAAPAQGPVAGAAPSAAAPSGVKYVAKPYPFTSYDPIGSATAKDKGGTFEMEVRFNPCGAGIDRLTLANSYTTIEKTDHEVVQSFLPMPSVAALDPRLGFAAFAAEKVMIDGTAVDLSLAPVSGQTLWKQTAPGAFEAEVDDGDGKPALRITRAFTLKSGEFELGLEQNIENLTGHPIALEWHQFGPTSLPAGIIRYGGDVRRVRFGFIQPQKADPDRIVQANDRAASLVTHANALGKPKAENTPVLYWATRTLWPSDDSAKNELVLAWAGMTNRYYTVAMYPALGAASPGNPPTPGSGNDKVFTLVETIDRLAIPEISQPSGGLFSKSRAPVGEMALRLNSPKLTVDAGKSVGVSMGVYAGPSDKSVIDHQPQAYAAGIDKVVVYTLGGMCGMCTFLEFAGLLHGFLAFLAEHVVFDWAIGIMLLVVCVRTILHPVTRWSQKSLYKFGKDMGKLAPKQKAIQQKYKDDPTKMREELSRLMREEGVSYAGALGCLPAFLQTPVWIALSSMIAFAFELHHTPAFFGVFQKIAPHWTFLADLSSPDRFIPLPWSVSVPLMGNVDGINLLPLLMGVVFFLQQKYLQPPPTTALTPEQEQQQKMMKVMTVVMFPLMMYNAPSGLALYFATNSSIAIIESKLIRKKADEEYKQREAMAVVRAASRTSGDGGGGRGGMGALWNRQQGAAKPEGFLARLRGAVEQAQKMREQQAKMRNKKR